MFYFILSMFYFILSIFYLYFKYLYFILFYLYFILFYFVYIRGTESVEFGLPYPWLLIGMVTAEILLSFKQNIAVIKRRALFLNLKGSNNLIVCYLDSPTVEQI